MQRLEDRMESTGEDWKEMLERHDRDEEEDGGAETVQEGRIGGLYEGADKEHNTGGL